MSIIEAKKQLSDAIAKFEHLKTELDNKSNLGFYSEQEWHKHLKDLGLEAAQLIQTTRNFDDNLIDLLNRKQQKLKRHSIWKKKHKKRIQQRKRHQAKKHEKWIKDIEWKVTMSSSVNATTVAAASVNNFSSLYTDNKQAQQQADDKKQIKILTKKLALLTNIRNLRRKKLEAKGHFFADEGDKFFNKVKQWHEDNKSTQSDSSQQDQQQVAHTVIGVEQINH
ncbi:hypothetical protein BD408DRAFT_428013 [Parasitella parasitica]|nr:hypothetical protein BD408DRAFT_428013 [Parasitella parasitica]